MQTVFLGGMIMASVFGGEALAREINLEVAGAKLSATLQIPEQARNAGKVPPVVLVLAGSGPTNRDGNSLAGKGRTYKKLADYLQTRGIASLRPDKRGVGKSIPEDAREEALSFEHYINDARAWITWLKKQPEVGPIILVGHSEGATIALAALQTTQADGKDKLPVAGLVLLAAPSADIASVVLRQVSENPHNPPEIVSEVESIVEALEAGKRVEQVSPPLRALFRPSVQPYLISSLKHKPLELIRKINIPTLLVQGDRDLQVRVKDAELLKAASKAKSAELVVAQGVNHVFVNAPLDQRGNIATYGDSVLPLARSVVLPIAEFVSEVAATQK